MALEKIRPKDLTEQSTGVAETADFIFDNGDEVRRVKLSTLRDILGYSVKDPQFAEGAVGDGVTNDTPAFAAAVAAVPLKTQIYVPAGTYILDGLTINRDVGFLLHPNAVLKHKASSTNHMIRYTVACTTPIEGGTFDGNSSNQVAAVSFAGSGTEGGQHSLLYTFSNGQVIRGVTFRNFMFAAVLDYQTQEAITFLNCKFLNGYNVSDGATYANAAIRFAPTGGAPHVTIRDSWFENESEPASGYKLCGGAFFANGASSFNSIVIDNCDFVRVGDDAVVGLAHFGIAAADFYERSKNASVLNSRFRENRYICIKAQNTENFTAFNNVCETSYTNCIDYTPGERDQADEFRTARFISNTVEASAEVGLYIRAGDSGGWRDVTVYDLTVRNSPYGIRVNGRTGGADNEGFGPLTIQACHIWTTAGNAIDFQYTRGDVKVLDCHLYPTGGNGIAATTAGSNPTSTFTLRGNTIECATTGYRCIRIFGVKELTLSDNTLSAFNASNVAIEIDQDGATPTPNGIEKLNYGPNIIRQGTESINWAIVQKSSAKQRVIATDFTVAQNSSTTETDLCSLTIPAYTLATNGDQLTFEASGIVAASANNKRIRVYFGSTLLYDSFGFAAASTCDFSLRGTITRVNATAQNSYVEVRTGISTTATPVDYISPTEDLATSLALKVTGQGGASNEVALGFIKARFVGVE